MIGNYFEISWRSLWKNKFYSALNIVGLSFGLASVMTRVFVVFEYYSADSDLKNKDQIFYLKSIGSNGDNYTQTTYPLLGEIVKSSPEVKAATHIQGWNSPKFRYKDKKINGNTRYVDSSFFQVVTLPLKYGNPDIALGEKYSVVLSEKKNQQLFGNINLLGKVISADDSINLAVTGVLNPILNYSSVEADLLLTNLLKDNPSFRENANWYNSFAENFLKFRANTKMDLNFDIKDKEAANSHFNSILNSLKSNPYVRGISTTSMVPSTYSYNYNTYFDPETGKEVKMRHTGADAGYLETYQIPFLEGRNFEHKNSGSEENSIMINKKKAMDALDWTTIKNKHLKEKNSKTVLNVVGVMNNFHYQNMQRPIEPLLLWNTGDEKMENNNYLSLRIDPKHKAKVLKNLQQQIENYFPGNPFEEVDLNEKISNQYQLIEGILKTLNCVAFLTIHISWLGMFGLISLIVKKRVKEIGIRKTLGARANKIVVLLSKEFVKLVVIAAVIAFPVAWMIMNAWLQDFAYRIELHLWMVAAEVL